MKDKPKTLYQYDMHHKLQRHKITQTCLPVPVSPELRSNRWRCRTRNHDFHGWDNIKDAKKDEIATVTTEISVLQAHRDKIFKSLEKKETD